MQNYMGFRRLFNAKVQLITLNTVLVIILLAIAACDYEEAPFLVQESNTMMSAPMQDTSDCGYQPSESTLTNEWLSVEERVLGLSIIWRKVADMSPFLASQPEGFDWNDLYFEYMTKVINAQSLMEYYDILSRFVASLEDGKSVVQPPIGDGMYAFPIGVRYIEDNFIVVASHQDYTAIPIGSKIIYVNGVSPHDFVEQNFGSRFGNRTPSVRENSLAQFFTADTQRSTMTLEALTPEGETITEKISFYPISEELMATISQMKQLDRRPHLQYATPVEHGAFVQVHEGGIHHISLLTFGNPTMPEAVRQYIEDTADTAKGFIIDIRGNGGGTGDLVILSQFADPRDFATVRAYMQVRDVGAMTLGSIIKMAERGEVVLSDEIFDMIINGHSAIDGRNMLESRHLEEIYDFGETEMWNVDLLYEQSLRLFDVPIVILADYNSASASESFVVSAQGVNNFTIMGTNTTGMAGDTPFFPLPGGGFLSLNVTKQLTPEGQIINNHGIMPDIWVSQNLADILEGVDTQLVAALEYLSEKLK